MKTLKTVIAAAVVFLLTGIDALSQEGRLELDAVDTVKTHVVKYPEHLVGVRYSVSFCGTFTSMEAEQDMVMNPLTVELLYTYYHPLWDYIGCFGFQTGIRYTNGGLKIKKYWDSLNQQYTTVQIPMLSAFHFDAGRHLRFPISVGPYVGYRLSTDKEGGWDCFDNRFEMGLEAHGGAAMCFGPVELYFEAGFLYCLTFLYDPEKYSSESWIYTHPYNIFASVGLHFNLSKSKAARKKTSLTEE